MEELEFKRSAIREIKKHPIIWDHVNKGPYSKATDMAWNKIESTLKVPKDKLRRKWNTIRSHYTEILMTRTIERNTKFPTWVFFHDLSFLYDRVKAKINEKMGGISPPLLQPRFDQIDPEAEPCPCCERPTLKLNDTTTYQQPIYTLTLQNLYETPPSKEALKQALDQSSAELPLSKGSKAKKGSAIIIPHPQNDIQRAQLVSRAPKRPLELQNHQEHVDQPVAKQKSQRRVYETTSEERFLVRSKMIECIKAHPDLYTKTPNSGHTRFTYAWQKVASQLGLPVHILKTRWKVCKQRYVEELTRQQNSGGMYRPTWESFDHMSFMKPYTNSEVENINRLREEIQRIVKERRNREVIDVCQNDDEDSTNTQTLPVESNVNMSTECSDTNDEPSHTVESIDLLTAENETQDGFLTNEVSSPAELLNSEDLRMLSPSDRRYLDVYAQDEDICKSPIETFNLCTDDEEEEDDDENTIYLDGNESIGSDVSVEVYEEEIVYFAEPHEEDVICLDDGDETDPAINQ